MRFGLTKRSENRNLMDIFERDFNTLFNDFFTMEPAAGWTPKVDVQEDEKTIFIKAELAGMEEKDLNVEVKDNVLTISGEKKEERTEEDKDRKYTYTERRFGSFSRSIALPEGIKVDEIKAEYKNGLLKVELPKSEAEQPRKIDIDVH